MFRDGHYLEVIKASDNCLATAVVTVQEKTIEIKKKKVTTNKWLDLEDWAALYKILERAILKIRKGNANLQGLEKSEWKKSTRQLDVTYTFDTSEGLESDTTLPTIRVTVSPAKKKTEKTESAEAGKKEKVDLEKRGSEKINGSMLDRVTDKSSDVMLKKNESKDVNGKVSKKEKLRRYLRCENLENEVLEEYVPDAPTAKKLCSDFTLEYIPSRKSILEGTQDSANVYTPTATDNKNIDEVIRYVPNSITTSKTLCEEYKPYPKTACTNMPQEYVPNSKGLISSIEEYQPDFTSKSMKFDDSYVPSSMGSKNEKSKGPSGVSEKSKSHKHTSRRKGESSTKKNVNLFS